MSKTKIQMSGFFYQHPLFGIKHLPYVANHYCFEDLGSTNSVKNWNPKTESENVLAYM